MIFEASQTLTLTNMTPESAEKFLSEHKFGEDISVVSEDVAGGLRNLVITKKAESESKFDKMFVEMWLMQKFPN